MIKVEVSNLQARVALIDTEPERIALRRALTFVVPGAHWMPSFRSGAWDGTFCFLNAYNMTFPPGLLSILPQGLQQRLVLVDTRRAPISELPSVDARTVELLGIELRDYQRELVVNAVQQKRAVLMSPTNAGKTETAAAVIKTLGTKTLFLTHIENLCLQTQARLEARLGFKVGMLASRTWMPRRVSVGMIQTLYMRLKAKDPRVLSFLANSVECLFLDEVHHLSSESWLFIAKHCNAYYRYGLSATPVLKDAISNLKLIGQTGVVLGNVTNADLIERGISAKPIVRMVSNRTIGMELQHKSWQAVYRLGVECNPARNKILIDLIHRAAEEKKPALVLVNTVRHMTTIGMELSLAYPKLQRKVVSINGSTPVVDRMRMLKDFKRGRYAAIIATPIFDEGMDVPEVRVLILGGGGKSHIKLLQRLGRGMRKKESGENVVEVYDFCDVGNKYLESHANRRADVYTKEGFDLEKLQIS